MPSGLQKQLVLQGFELVLSRLVLRGLEEPPCGCEQVPARLQEPPPPSEQVLLGLQKQLAELQKARWVVLEAPAKQVLSQWHRQLQEARAAVLWHQAPRPEQVVSGLFVRLQERLLCWLQGRLLCWLQKARSAVPVHGLQEALPRLDQVQGSTERVLSRLQQEAPPRLEQVPSGQEKQLVFRSETVLRVLNQQLQSAPWVRQHCEQAVHWSVQALREPRRVREHSLVHELTSEQPN